MNCWQYWESTNLYVKQKRRKCEIGNENGFVHDLSIIIAMNVYILIHWYHVPKRNNTFTHLINQWKKLYNENKKVKIIFLFFVGMIVAWKLNTVRPGQCEPNQSTLLSFLVWPLNWAFGVTSSIVSYVSSSLNFHKMSTKNSVQHN